MALSAPARGGDMLRFTRVLVVLAVFFSASFAIFLSTSHAVSASPNLHTFTQPDGTVFNARQWGDEHLSGWEMENGYTIVFVESQQTWYFADLDSAGDLVPSLYRVGIDEPPVGLPKRLRPRPPTTFTSETKALSKSLELAIPAATGTRNIPIVLVNFADTSPTYSKSAFNNLLFSLNTYSLKDYFREVSYNKFDISSGTSGILGWVTVSEGRSYYGRDKGSTSKDRDYWVADLVYEAVQLADAQTTYSDYDSDGDCIVDSVMIVHQGMGQEAAPDSNNIWSKSWNLSNAKLVNRLNYPGQYISNDVCAAGGYVKVDGFTIMPELHSDGGLTTMGVFAHEYGHALGLPDLYDTDYSSKGVGIWSLMAAGSWTKASRSGDRPAHLDAWSKFRLGWVTPTLVSGTLVNEQIAQAATAADVYQLRAGTPDSSEYFLVENRQQARFDAGLPGGGLLVWHIDGERITSGSRAGTVNTSECYPPSSCASAHYGVSLVQADREWGLENDVSEGDSGDPFPGSTNNVSWNGLTMPASSLWSGAASNVSVSNVSSSGATMTATLSVQACTYVLSSSSALHTSTGGAGSFQLQTGSGCAWTATDNASWVTVSSPSSGNGTATVSYTVSANTTGALRTGTVTAGGLTFNIAQSATAASQVLQNGNFEQGSVYWEQYAANGAPIVTDDYAENHTTNGSWSAFLGGYNEAYDIIAQTVTIPEDAVQASLTFYRLIKTSESTSSTVYDTMRVMVLDQFDSSNILANLKTFSNLDASSGWMKSSSFDLAQLRGRTVRIAFLGTTDYSLGTSFFVDDVVITTSNTATVSVSPNSRLYPAVGGNGIISITGTGSWTAQSNSSWLTVDSGQSGSNSGTVAYSVAPNAAQTPRTASIMIGGKIAIVIQEGMAGGQELLTNGSFENGAGVGWTQSGTGTYTVIGSYTDFAAYSGSWYAYLADYEDAEDTITQRVTIPSDATSVYLQYYYKISSSETSSLTEYDQMWVFLSDAYGNSIATLKYYSNLNETTGWRQSEAFNMNEYRGRTLYLSFKAANDFSLNTAFLVDAVQLRVLRNSAAPTVTAVSPAESASGTSVSGAVSVTFDQQMIPSTLNSNTFLVKKGTTSLVGTITYDSSSNTARLTPQARLSYGSDYVVTLSTGIKNSAGVGLAAAKSWTFSTEADNSIPVVTAFAMPSSSTSRTVAVSAFTATDEGGVAGYLLTENAAKPLAAAAGWSATPPTSHTFSGIGVRTLYAWAKDEAGNVSNSVSATLTVTEAVSGRAGDCDSNGSVTIAEVQSSINMYLGLRAVAACVDMDGSGQVTIAEVQKAVNGFLGL